MFGTSAWLCGRCRLLSNGARGDSFVRATSRSIVSALGGNIDQAKRKYWSRQSTDKLAAYLSRYMPRAFEGGEAWSNRYSGSQSVEIPEAVRTRWRGESMAQLISFVFDECAVGPVDCMTWVSGWGDVFFLSTELPPRGRPAFGRA